MGQLVEFHHLQGDSGAFPRVGRGAGTMASPRTYLTAQCGQRGTWDRRKRNEGSYFRPGQPCIVSMLRSVALRPTTALSRYRRWRRTRATKCITTSADIQTIQVNRPLIRKCVEMEARRGLMMGRPFQLRERSHQMHSALGALRAC
jgi:hypothetical protein